MKRFAGSSSNLIILTLFTAFTFSGCGKKDSSDPAPAATPRSKVEAQLFEQEGFTGSWQNGCVARDDRSERTTISFQGDEMSRVWTLYLVPGCPEDKRALQHETKNHQSYMEQKPDIAEWKTINSVVKAVEVTMLSQELAARYNRGTRYEISDWKMDKPRDVAGKKFDAASEAELKVGDVRLRTFKIEGDILKVAKYDGDTALRSDDELSTFKRQ